MRTVKEWLVPRRDLVAGYQMLFEQGRISIARGVKHVPALQAQITGFTLNKKKQKYEAEAEDLHDDLVVCLMLAGWWISFFKSEVDEGAELLPHDVITSWGPLDRFNIKDEPQRDLPQTVQPWREPSRSPTSHSQNSR